MDEIRERLLVVDDDESLRHFLTRSLQKQGYDVTNASDGMQGLEVLRNSDPFAVLVTDLLMPRMGGVELIKQARAIDARMEIIVITAADSVELAISAMRDGGVYDYIQKPLDSANQLAVVVERAAAHRRLVLERAALQQKADTEARRLHALVSNIGDAILVVSADGTVTVANPAARKIVGRDDILGELALAVLPRKLVSIVENWQALGGQSTVIMEIPWQSDSVQMVSLTPIHDHQDNWQGWALLMRDITPFKRLDELKTQAMLDAANKIRRPLAEAMSVLVELNVQSVHDEQMAESVYKLTEIWKRIQLYGEDLVNMAHREASQESLVTEVDLNVALERIRNELGTELYWQGKVTPVITPHSQLPTIETDGQMLYQLLKGLVMRAAMRSPLHGNIRVDARELNGRVYIDVSDDGPAVTDTGVLHMFDKSVIDPTTGGGNPGLELARAKSVLDEVGGQLWVGGKTRRGSTVTICLPPVAQPVHRKVVQVRER